MKKIKTIFKKIGLFFSKLIDKIFVVPISKLILKINEKFDKPSKKFENWLSRSNTLLFISLLIAIFTFIIIDQKILTFSESSAEVLNIQNINVLYDEDNYVVEGIPDNVDITLIGSKADLYVAKQSPTNEVVIDLWGLKPGTHKVDIQYNQLSNGIKYNINPSVATVVIYEKVLATKPLSVDLLNQDALDQRYFVEEMKSTTDTVVIKGASYKVEQVATVKALVDVKNLPNFELGEKITVSSTLRAYDKYGNVVDVEISPANTDVELKISSSSKVVPIQVVPSGKVIYNKGISNFIINNNEKTTVTIYGESNSLSNIEYIPVYIDVEGLSEDTQFKVDLEKPNGVKYMDTNSAIIDVKLSNDISNVELQDIAISQINLGSNYGVTPVDQDSVSVKLKGVSDIVKNITASDIKVYVDLKGLGVGIHDVDIIVTGNDPRVEYLSSTLKIKVQIYEK
ncbi:MAG TPA: hypothetical protein IAC20_05805 [Candidatus Faecisoma merdavium]|nr:hypothetical protein [Candidatus Faecisoma merdavium]